MFRLRGDSGPYNHLLNHYISFLDWFDCGQTAGWVVLRSNVVEMKIFTSTCGEYQSYTLYTYSKSSPSTHYRSAQAPHSTVCTFAFSVHHFLRHHNTGHLCLFAHHTETRTTATGPTASLPNAFQIGTQETILTNQVALRLDPH